MGDQGHHPRQGPQGGGVAKGFLRPALQVGGQLEAIQRLEAGLATGPARMFEGLGAAPRPSRVPAPSRLVAHPATPRHLGFGAPPLEEFDRPQAPTLQRGEVSFYTFGITHIVLDNDKVIVFTILCKDQ